MNNLTVPRGDTQTLRLTVVDSDGQPVDLSGFTVVFTAKRSYDDAQALIQKSLGEGIALGSPGECFITLDPTDTWPLAQHQPETLLWDVEIEAAGVVRTPVSGRLKVTPDVGRTNEV